MAIVITISFLYWMTEKKITSILAEDYYSNDKGGVSSVTTEECFNTRFGLSTMRTPLDKQKACAIVTLEDAKAMDVTDIKNGEISLSIIESFANNALDNSETYGFDSSYVPLKQCLDNAENNAAFGGCYESVEASLQNIIRSVVQSNIIQEEEISYIANDTSPELFAETLREYWTNWYISSTSGESLKARECDIEGTTSFGGSATFTVVSMCYIKHDAIEIISLLKQERERKNGFEKKWSELF